MVEFYLQLQARILGMKSLTILSKYLTMEQLAQQIVSYKQQMQRL